ncbi:MAG: hypothetical protein KY476_18855, partial [Planctomycetes bacterium]|nr:hypothetical protein [Planctomycetota bacterium]
MPLLSWIQRLLSVPERFARSQRTRSERDRRRREELVDLFVTRLEDRRVLTAVTVTNLVDVTNGDTSGIAALVASDGGDGISLREAMLAANATAGADEINFDSGLFTPPGQQQITLNGTQLPTITGDLAINGPGAAELAISGNNASRVFEVGAGSSVEIVSLTVTGGSVSGTGVPGVGGGILIDAQGGAASLTVIDSVFTGNTGNGGAIGNVRGSLTVIDSSFSSNSANMAGGAILSAALRVGTTTIIGSTFSGNTANFSGGALYQEEGSLTVVNSTISGNAAGQGGGIANTFSSTLTVTNSTITGNSADRGSGTSANNMGGGIFSDARAGGVQNAFIANTIIAGNSAPVGNPDVGGNPGANNFSSLGHNLIGDVGSTNGFSNGVNGDQVGTSDSPIAPRLGPLADNGGPTFTHALLAGSPAIDAGANYLALDPGPDGIAGTVDDFPLDFDQRGSNFARIIDGNLDGTARVDIGAFERAGGIAAFADPRVMPFFIDPAFRVFDVTSDGVSGFYFSGPDNNTGNGFEIFRVSMAGLSPSIVASGPFAGRLTTDGTFIYLINPNSGPFTDTQILRVPIGGGPIEAIYTGSAVGQPIVDGGDITVVPGGGTPTQLVTTDAVQGRVHRMDATNPVYGSLTQLNGQRYGGFFDREHFNLLDVEGGIVYVADTGLAGFPDTPPRIESIPVAGGSFSTLFTGTLPGFSPGGIEVVGSSIYLTNRAEILQMPTTGGTPTTFLADPRFHSLRAMHFEGGSLYVVDSRPGSDIVWQVALAPPALPAAVNLPGAGGTFTVARDGGDLVVKQGVLELLRAPNAAPGPLVINGTAGDDTLVVDFTNGNPIPTGGIEFNGGAQGTGGDELQIICGTATSVTHNFTNASDGSIEIDGSLITYTGLEPVVDNLVVANRVFTFNGGGESITLAAAAAGSMIIDSNLAESVTFLNPTASLFVDGGTGDDVIQIVSVDPNFRAALNINGGDGNDRVEIESTVGTLTLGSGAVTGDLSVFAETIEIDANLDTTGGDSDGAVSFNGVTTVAGGKTISSGTGNTSIVSPGTIRLGNPLGAGAAIQTTTGRVLLHANQADAGGQIVLENGASITTAGGDVLLGGGSAVDGNGLPTGFAEGVLGASNERIGILLKNASISAGAGNITLRGRGSDDVGVSNFGIVVQQSAGKVQTTTGNILLEGQGGGTATGDNNSGVLIIQDAVVEATASGNVELRGTGGVGTQSNRGVRVTDKSTVRSATGGVTLTGVAGGSGMDNYGVEVFDSLVRTGGAAALSITGTGSGTGIRNHGFVMNVGTVEATGSGAITIQGTAAGGADDIAINGGRVGAAAGTGATTLTADRITLSAPATIAGAGSLVLQPLGVSTSIGLGG